MDFSFPLPCMDTSLGSAFSLLDLGVFLLTVLLGNLFPLNIWDQMVAAGQFLSPMPDFAPSRHWYKPGTVGSPLGHHGSMSPLLTGVLNLAPP